MDTPALIPNGVGTGHPIEQARGSAFGRALDGWMRSAGIAGEHATMLTLAAALLFVLRLGDLVVGNAAETLFVKRVGPGWLPLAFVAQGLVLLVVLNYVGTTLDRGRRVETLRALILGAAIGPLILRAFLLTGHPLAYGMLFVVTESAAVAMALTIWTLLADLVPGTDARRVAAPLIVAGLLGEALGSFLSAPLASQIGIENLLTVAALVAAAAGLLLQQISHRMLIRLDVVRPPKLSAPNLRVTLLGIEAHTREALGIARRSRLLRFLLATTALGASVVPFVDFQFHWFANATFARELDLLLFYSLLKGLLALGAVGLQLLAFNWLRREAGVANTLLTLPLGATASLLLMLTGAGVATASLVWAMLRLSVSAVDDPARRFLHELFPTELRARVDWLVDRNGRALAMVGGGLLLLAATHMGDPSAAAVVSLGLALVWLVVALVLRARYGQLVLATSLANRIDFDQLRSGDVSHLLDRSAVRLLEREAGSGVPARVQLAIELLRQVRAPRLPQLLASSYIRQPPVLRPLFLTTIQEALREVPVGWPGLRHALLAIIRLARQRVSAAERAVLIRIYGESAARHHLDRREIDEFLGAMARDEATAVHLAIAAARYRLDGGIEVIETALDRALASSDEHDAQLAVTEIEDLVRSAPDDNGRLLSHVVSIVDDPTRSTRLRAHAIGAVARIHSSIADVSMRTELDDRIVPLALSPDPRLASAALGYLHDDRFLPLVETHVLPNLVAGNHHVREEARDAVRFFGTAVVPALLDVVRSGSRRERMAVSRLLGSYPIRRRAHHDLIGQEMRGLGEQIVGVAMLREAAQPAYAMMADRLEEEATEHVRAILRLLYADTGDETLLRVERQLWSRDAQLRRAAIETLEHLTARQPATRELHHLVDDTSLHDRAALARPRVPTPCASIDELLERCASDGNWVTRLVACHTIGAAGRRELSGVLLQAAASHRTALRLEAERALAILNGETTEEAPMTIVEKMLLLKETELFRDLDARDLAGVASVTKEAHYAPTEMIIQEGDRGDFLAIVTGGKVSIVKADGAGGEYHIRDLGPPEVLGEMSLLDEAPRSASVRALDRSHLLLLSRAEFEALTEEYPGIALGIARVLSRRLQTLTTQAARR